MEILPLSSGSKGNSIFVSDGQTNVLLDCGISMKEIERRCKYQNIDYILISHSHKDHCKSVKDYLRFGTECIMSPDTADEINLNLHGINKIQPFIEYTFGSFKVLAFELEHDVKNYGYVLTSMATKERLVYITDTAYCKYKFPDVNYWCIECNHVKSILDNNTKNNSINMHLRNRIVKTHMNLETLKQLLVSNGISKLKSIYVTHLSGLNSHEEHIKTEIQELTGVPVYICT